MLSASLPSAAMNFPHYELDSLTFLSTDIVIAHITKTADSSATSQSRFVATVADSLYGPLRPGENLETLSESLNFFQPMNDGQEVILFLDRRPHKTSSLFPEASKSPFALVPSGVYLVDTYQHVHRYSQQMNPGPYVAEGYEIGSRSMPTMDADLALPSLTATEARISESLKTTGTMRTLLDSASIHDKPALVDLLKARSEHNVRCGWQSADAIAQNVVKRLFSFDDPALLLQIYPLTDRFRFSFDFLSPAGNAPDDAFTKRRLKYLTQTISNSKAELSLRAAAVEILSLLSKFGSRNVPGSIENHYFGSSAAEIRTAAKRIVDDDSDESHLRAMCVYLLHVNDPEMMADLKEVHSRTSSSELRFAIENAFLNLNDDLYHFLNPRGGPVASIVQLSPEDRCHKIPDGKLAFVANIHEDQQYSSTSGAAALASNSTTGTIPEITAADLARQFAALASESGKRSVQQPVRFVLTSAETGQRVLVKEAQYSGTGVRIAEARTELDQSSPLPPGTYNLALEYLREGKVVSTGYPLPLSVVESAAGNLLSAH